MTDLVTTVIASAVVSCGIGIFAGIVVRSGYLARVAVAIAATGATFALMLPLMLRLYALDGASLGTLALSIELLLALFPRTRYFVVPLAFGIVSGLMLLALNPSDNSFDIFLAGAGLGALPVGVVTALVGLIDVAHRRTVGRA